MRGKGDKVDRGGHQRQGRAFPYRRRRHLIDTETNTESYTDNPHTDIALCRSQKSENPVRHLFSFFVSDKTHTKKKGTPPWLVQGYVLIFC